jgi:hypothetical protein
MRVQAVGTCIVRQSVIEAVSMEVVRLICCLHIASKLCVSPNLQNRGCQCFFLLLILKQK